jgi:hyperosmotically inducible protein
MQTTTFKVLVLGAASLLVAACEEPASTTTTTPAAQREAANADIAKSKAEAEKKAADKALDDAKAKADAAADLGPAESVWASSWSTFHAGKEKTMDAGDWTMERGADGTYTAWRKVKDATAKAGEKIEDAAVTTAVKAKLLADDDVKGLKIDVDTKQNVVHLKGTVDKPEHAGEAMRIALGTAGVDKVVSHLKWAAPAPIQ